jgi:hypothetical protein
MCRPKLAAFAVLLLGLCAAAPPAPDPARALVRRALQAQGAAADLSQRAAVRLEVKGKANGPVGATLSVTGEALTQPGGIPTRTNLNLEVLGKKVRLVQVANRDRSWQSINGTLEPLHDSQKQTLGVRSYPDRVAGLSPLLHDRGFTLTLLGPSRHKDREVRGVRVSRKGRPDVSLYFDAATGLLVRYTHPGKNPFVPDKEGTMEVSLSDYREVNTGSAEERLLRAARVRTDGRALLDYLRRCVDPDRVKKVRVLVRRLADDSFAVRERAEADLKALGKVALPALREAASDDDPEVARRARRCLAAIGPGEEPSALAAAAVRLVVLRRPAGAAEALLDVLPSADAALAREVRAALLALAVRDGRPEPALLRALKDRDSARRAAAAAALGKDGGAYRKQPGRRLYFGRLLLPMKMGYAFDGKVVMELEILDVHFFNFFADKEFARP